MRILAIRGENLASLARSFAVELAAGPLADAGVFAITGPVGAGKSTLLDALSLALFDRTPRLSGRGGTPIADDGQDRGDWLRANDPRTLLRRDAVEGHAEVDFVGRDGVAYRARWAVRRARRRADGRLQDAEMSLTDLRRDLVVASGRRTDVLAQIQQRLGLDFAQFCRSVLLAQGEFHAFLHAAADERAKLLETLTGASIYRRLSKAAHDKRRALEQRVSNLRMQFDGSEVLSDEGRARLEGAARRLAEQIAICEVGIRKAREYVLWHQQAEKLQQAEGDANVALRAALDADEAAAPRRMALEARQRALAVVPRWEVAAEARQRAAAAEGEAQAAAERAQAAATEEARCARALADVLRSRLGADGDAPAVARELPKWEATLLRWQQVDDELRDADARAPALRQRRDQAAAALATLERQVEELDVVRAQAADVLARAEQDVAAGDFDALHPRRAQLTADAQRRADVRTARERQQQAEAHARQRREALAAARAVVEEQRGQRDAAEARAAEVAAALREARERLRAAEQQHGLEALRAQLVDGEACPLCGAEHHPAAQHDGPDLQTVQRAVRASERVHDQAQQQLATLVAGVERRAAEAVEREAESARADEQAAAAARDVAAALPAGVAPAQVDAWLAAQDEALRRREQELAAIERDAAARSKALRAAREAVQQGERVQREASGQLRAAAKQERAAADALREAEQRREQLRAAAAELRDVLEPACAGLAGGAAALAALGEGRLAALRATHDAFGRGAAAATARSEAAAAHAQALARAERLRRERDDAQEHLRRALHVHAVADDDVAVAQRLGADALADEAQQLRVLADAVTACRATLQERSRKRREHEDAARPSLDAADAEQALEDAQRERQRLTDVQVEHRARIVRDDDARRHRSELQPRLQRAEQEAATWGALDDLIGSSGGDAFAVYAQGLTLDLLLLEANRRLEELARRYRLERNTAGATRSGELDFVVVDLDLGGARRSLHTLSGGETFLVSLALALALATLAAPRSRVETLFLDEGFGTLDAHNLEIALGALDSLQATGCQVGVISHVDGFAERIGAVVEVRPEGSGQSRVVVP